MTNYSILTESGEVSDFVLNTNVSQVSCIILILVRLVKITRCYLEILNWDGSWRQTLVYVHKGMSGDILGRCSVSVIVNKVSGISREVFIFCISEMCAVISENCLDTSSRGPATGRL